MFFDTAVLSDFTGQTENGASFTGSTLSTGDLRRRYNFGSMVSQLAVARDPFFRFVSMARKSPTDDSQFKYTEERPSFHKRYAYVVAHSTDNSSYTTNSATVTATNIEQGDTWYVKLKTDYKSAGNIASRYGNVSSAVAIGATGTMPQFLFPGLIIKIPFGAAYNTPNDYILAKIEEVTKDSANEQVIAKLTIVRTLATATNNVLQWSSASAPMSTVYNVRNAAGSIENLESKRTYVSGNAFAAGSGYPESWADNPYSTGYGQTQIFKTALGMDNSTRAHVLKYAGNEFARLWANKLIDHKWDIETTGLFGTQYTDPEGVQYTQGALDYIVKYGTTFTLAHGSKTPDDFLDDMSQYLDPRYNSMSATVWMCDTYTYNWLNKLSGYFNNTVQISPNFNGDFMFKGISNALSVPISKISTLYGTMNLVRNVHLDGTGVHIMAVNLSGVKWRPLVGNGINRDTSVYVGVQTLENSGVDKRVDLILTEGGFEWSLPETHAAWVYSA